MHHTVTRNWQIALLRRWPSRVVFRYLLPTTISRDYMSERGEVFVSINSSQILQSKYPSYRHQGGARRVHKAGLEASARRAVVGYM